MQMGGWWPCPLRKLTGGGHHQSAANLQQLWIAGCGFSEPAAATFGEELGKMSPLTHASLPSTQ